METRRGTTRDPSTHTRTHAVGPVITPFEFPKRTQLGNRIRLLCSIMQGDAPFRFQWMKDGKSLDPAPLSLGVRSDDFSMDLTFARVTPRHNGNYTCIASNDVASVSHSAILVVDGTFDLLLSDSCLPAAVVACDVSLPRDCLRRRHQPSN